MDEKHILRSEPAWQFYVNSNVPDAKAEVVIDNSDFLHPHFVLYPNGDGVGVLHANGEPQ